MVDTVFVGFNTTADNDVALRKIAAERRIDRTAVLNEAITAYIAAHKKDEGDVNGSTNNAIDNLVAGLLTPLEVKMQMAVNLNRACIEQRKHSESE